MFSTLSNGEVVILAMFNLSSANALNLVMIKISNSGTHGGDLEPDPYTCFIDADVIDTYGAGRWVLGVRELTQPELDGFRTVQSLPDLEYVQKNWLTNMNFTISFKLKITQVTCTSRVEGSSIKSIQGVKVRFV